MGGGSEVVEGVTDVQDGEFVAVAFEDALHGDPAGLEAEARVDFEEVAAGTGKGTGVSAAGLRELRGEVEIAGVFGGGEPAAGLTAGLGEPGEDFAWVASRVLFADRAKSGQAGGGSVGGEGVLIECFVGSAEVEQNALAGAVEFRTGLVRSSRRFDAGQRVFGPA